MTEESITESISLADSVRCLIKRYLAKVGQEALTNLHQMVLEQIEPPLLQAVMEKCKYNQSRAAKLLGLSRGTCRTLLIKYFDEQYCGRREAKEKQ